uniref:Small ribosomal subunit protein bS20c n=1 Tax=Ophidocladus simpliciusculus TaxID=1261574 RepID=A0A1Z1MJJ8_9FLOR|nr:ribosomal protein S20 [Ophidocladus simpliciusculus]ARW65995.1 ribosomal protein S20 [Ophidocladus simpliciusculus]
MSQISSTTKKKRITLRNRHRNKRYKLSIKVAIKRYLSSVQSSQNNEKISTICQKNLSLVYKRIDKAVKRKVMHQNTASRKKAKLAKIINYTSIN